MVFGGWALFSVDALLVYHYLGDRLTGAYSIAYSAGSVALLLTMAVTAVWAPTAQRILTQAPDRLRRLLARAVALVLAAGATLALGSVALQPLVPHVLHGAEFRQVGGCVTWIVIGFTALALAKLCEGVLYAEGRIVAIYCLGAVANIVATVVLIPDHGILAAAWVTAGTYALVAGLLAVPVLGRPGRSPIRA